MAGNNWPLRSSDLKVKTVWLYYVEGMTQEQIAEQLGVSRVKIMRTLAAATSEGIVVTRINAATAEQVELERRLEEKWGLSSAIVVPTPENGGNLEKALGNAVASYLDQEMQDGMTLAIGGGATLYACVQFLEQRKLNDACVVALVGSLPHSRWINPSVVAARVAEVYQVDSYQITAPVILDEQGLRNLLWRQTELRSFGKCHNFPPWHCSLRPHQPIAGLRCRRQYSVLLRRRKWTSRRSRNQPAGDVDRTEHSCGRRKGRARGGRSHKGHRDEGRT